MTQLLVDNANTVGRVISHVHDLKRNKIDIELGVSVETNQHISNLVSKLNTVYVNDETCIDCNISEVDIIHMPLSQLNLMGMGPGKISERVPGPADNVFDGVTVVDDWSSSHLAVLNGNHVQIPFGKITRGLSIGSALLVLRKSRNDLVSLLVEQGSHFTFISREFAELNYRSDKIETYTGKIILKGQDRSLQIIEKNVVLTMVFDGHGTDDVPEFILQNYGDFTEIIEEPFPITNAEMKTRITEVFKKFERRINSIRNAYKSGSTLVLAAHKLSTQQVFFAHIGDSRAVWSFPEGSKASLSTIDHKPDLEKEKKRIEDAKGYITHDKGDVPRVGGNLATSRSFGDTNLKVPLNKAKKNWVSILPDVVGPYTFTSGSIYALASDGVWDVMQNQEVINMIRRTEDINREAQHICDVSRNKGSRDDITMTIVVVK